MTMPKTELSPGSISRKGLFLLPGDSFRFGRNYTVPCSSIACATFMKPAIFAPFT